MVRGCGGDMGGGVPPQTRAVAAVKRCSGMGQMEGGNRGVYGYVCTLLEVLYRVVG